VSSPAIHERADAWLRSERGADPWFLWVHYFDPHHDYHVHPGVTEKFGTGLIDRYDGEIAFTDTHVGKLLATLRDIGEDEETIVVFVSDHGEEFGDHGLQGHGRALHREVTRLALAVRVPGWPHAGVDEPVHAVDLLPTLLELLDVPLPKSPLAGRSLIPLMRGGRGARLEPRGLLAEVSLYAGSVHSTYRLGRFKLFEHREPGGAPARSLFDIEADPNETVNLADRYPRVVEEYARALREERRAALALRMQLGEPERVDLNEDDLTRLRALGYVE
jgi:arylsulfatase A-like enzyme